MGSARPLLVALLLVPGVLIGVWIGTGSGQGAVPPRPPGDVAQQAQAPRGVPSTRPAQQKTQHEQSDAGKNAPPAAATETQPDIVNGHTTGQFHLTPGVRPQPRRFRLDTTSLRGVFHQQIHGSKRSLRSVEDFTEHARQERRREEVRSADGGRPRQGEPGADAAGS